MIEIDIFVHSHWKTGQPCEVAIFSFSGLNIPEEFLIYALSCNHDEKLGWIEQFKVPTEEAIKIYGDFNCENGQYWFECKRWFLEQTQGHKEGTTD